MVASERQVAIGVIGLGAIGRVHGQNLASLVPGATLAAVADIDRAAIEAFTAQCPFPAAHEDYRDLLADPAVEAVVICSPPDTHAQIIEEAAAAGRHILCEKPIDCDLTRIDRALAAVQKAGVKLQLGFNRRWDANFLHVHDVVASGKIGRPYILHITSRDPRLPATSQSKASAGLFLDTTIHDFDIARYLMGSEVTSLYVLGGNGLAESGGIDTALVSLRFASGAMGTIDNSVTVYGYDQRVEVFGSEGAIAVENERPHHATLTDREGSHTALPLHFYVERYAGSYLAEASAFVDCILRDTEPAVTGTDGRMATIIGLAAQRSYDEGRPVTPSEVTEA